jgi:hypothetical protein
MTKRSTKAPAKKRVGYFSPEALDELGEAVGAPELTRVLNAAFPPQNIAAPECGACRFYEDQRCRRWPPKRAPGNMLSQWPLVNPNDWCGEFAAKKGPVALSGSAGP